MFDNKGEVGVSDDRGDKEIGVSDGGAAKEMGVFNERGAVNVPPMAGCNCSCVKGSS